MTNNEVNRAPLLPVRHEVQDFFVCDIFDAVPKGDQAGMEHPIFSLSTKPDHNVRRYAHNGVFITVKPGFAGLANVHDRDVLIFCISQLIAAQNAGRAISNVLRFKAYDLLVSTNRLTGGSAYAQLRAAFERLTQTRIETNIRIGDFEAIDDFGLIDRIRIVRETRDGRMLDVEVTLSEWVMSAVKSNEVLTLHRNYFRLRKPLERRIYDLGRKHCGAKPEFTLNLDTLWKKAGSQSTRKEFRRLVRAICEADREHDHMPDYAVRFNDERDQLTFTRRDSGDRAIAAIDAIRLDPDTYEEAREAVPGYDIYYVEQEWRNWIASTGKPLPKKPDLAFIRFCATWYANNGKAA